MGRGAPVRSRAISPMRKPLAAAGAGGSGRAGAKRSPLLVNNASGIEPDALTAFDSQTMGAPFRPQSAKRARLSVRDFARQCPDGADGLVVNMLDQRRCGSHAAFLFLTSAHQIRPVDGDADHARRRLPRAAFPRQRDRAGAPSRIHAKGDAGFPQSRRSDTAEARVHRRRNRQGRSSSLARDAGHDGPRIAPLDGGPASWPGRRRCWWGSATMNIIPSSRVRRLR